jgi:hypothetical protein
LVWLLLERALFAGNGVNLNHGGKIANKKCQQLENIFHQFIKIRLTTSQTLKNKAFSTIASKEQISWPRETFKH